MFVILIIARIVGGPTGITKITYLTDEVFRRLPIIVQVIVIVIASLGIIFLIWLARVDSDNAPTFYILATILAAVLITGVFTKITMWFSRSGMYALLTEEDSNNPKKRINKLDKISEQFERFESTQKEILATLKSMDATLKSNNKALNDTDSKEGSPDDNSKEGSPDDNSKEGSPDDNSKEGSPDDNSKEGSPDDNSKEGMTPAVV